MTQKLYLNRFKCPWMENNFSDEARKVHEKVHSIQLLECFCYLAQG